MPVTPPAPAAATAAPGTHHTPPPPCPRREAKPGAPFKEVALDAYMARVDLSAHGFYRTPDITGSVGSMPFNYFSFGTAGAAPLRPGGAAAAAAAAGLQACRRPAPAWAVAA
jgi:hypothetical protein